MSIQVQKKAAYILGPILAILLCALIFWGSWKLTTKLLGIDTKGGSSSSTVEIVDVTGKTADEAKQILDSKGIKYEIAEEYSADVPEGSVIKQDPVAGRSYDKEKSRPVILTVSKGKKTVKVPEKDKIVGKTEEEAKQVIESYELKPEVKSETSMTVPEGTVIKMEPESNAEVDAGSIVTIYVSSGTGLEKITVPYVVEKNIDDAKKELSKLEVNVIYEEDTSKSNGVVLKQSIQVGDVVEEGTAITLTVNKIQEIKEGTVNIHVKSLTGYKEPTTPTKTTNETENKTESKNETPTPKNVSVRVKVNEESVYNEKVAENTEVVNVTVKGKGTITVKVYIDEVLKDTRQMDLNSENRVIDIK